MHRDLRPAWRCLPVVPVRIDTIHTLRATRLARPLAQPEFRIVTESGQLVGRTYRATVHSILDGENAMARVVAMEGKAGWGD